jgi:Ion channel
MLLALLIMLAVALLTIGIHYEVFRVVSDLVVPRLADIHRLRVAVVVFACFCAHVVEILLFAVTLSLTANYLGFGKLVGPSEITFVDYFHLAIESYTTLGLGDITPTGYIRLLTGFEGLLGLIMITWSASFTFLEMQRLWQQRDDGGSTGD